MLVNPRPAQAAPSEESANLDQLRSVAFLVFADHLFETIASTGRFNVHPFDYHMGRIGVLLFFVHTSLVLMRSLRRMAAAGYVLADRATPRLPGAVWFPSLLGLMAVYVWAASMLGNDLHCAPLQWLVVGASIPVFRECTWPRVNAGAKLIARYSYSIYLFHLIAMPIAFRFLGLESLARLAAPTLPQYSTRSEEA